MLRRLSAPVLVIALAASACRRGPSVAADAAPPPSLKGAPRSESPRTTDPLWTRARDGDPIHLGELAAREGAEGLLEGVEDGGDTATTALRAMPYADDAEAALQRLAEIAVQLDAEQAAPVLDALLSAMARPMRDVEPIDPEGARVCAQAMLEIAKKGSASKSVRAMAVSILRRLAERRAFDPQAIPTDLDAK